MGTDLQEVFDAFFVKVTSVDFTGKESMVVQFMSSAIAKCYRHTYDNLEYVYDDALKEGHFINTISKSSVELIAMFMVKEYYFQRYSLLSTRRQHIGTQAFNKLPDMKQELEIAISSLNHWSAEIEKFLMEFPDYSDER